MTWSAGAVLTAAQLNTYLPQAWSSWTPTITASSGTFTTTSGSGRFIQYGKTVLWSATLTLTTAGTATGTLLFTLPATAAGAAAIGGGIEVTNGLACTVFTSGAVATGSILRYDAATVIASGRTLRVSGSYEVA